MQQQQQQQIHSSSSTLLRCTCTANDDDVRSNVRSIKQLNNNIRQIHTHEKDKTFPIKLAP